MNRYIDDFIKYKIPVFPLGKHSKEPLPGSKGFKDATTDEKIIRSWDAENYGIPTGDISAIFVYDCDIKAGVDGVSGFLKILKVNSLFEYIKKYPDALIIKTGSGGYHFYYGIPTGLDHNLRNTTNINGIKGLDVRGNGGYVVSPGSIHPNGNKYEVMNGSLSNIPLMPEELYGFWYSHDHPDLSDDDFNEPRTSINLNDNKLNLSVKTCAMIFKKTPVNEGHELLMSFSGALALRDIDIEKTKLILNDAAKLNHWNGKIKFATVQDSYNRVKLQKSGKIKEEEKFKTFVKGYTTLKRIIMENKENYENYSEIMKNLSTIFEQVDNSIQLINKAYDNNEVLSIETLKEWYKSLKNLDLKPSELDELIIKFKKIVYVSLASLLHATRLKHKGPDNTDIIDDQIYIKLGKMYRADSSNSYIRGILNSIFNNNISSRAKLEIIAQISDLASIVDYEDATSIIKFQNDYIYNLKTQEITPFTDDTFVIKQFGFNYDPNATCQDWLNFINTSVANSDIPVLQEFLGYIFYKGLPAQNFLVLKGPTRAGKGTVLGIIEDMLGESNVSSVPASALFSKEDTHMDLWQLEGKLANLDGEVEPYDLMHIANLKKLTGMDSIVSNQKYKNQHSFINMAKLIFALNSLPKIKLNDAEVDSFLSRIIIVNFIHSHADDADPTLKDRLETEMSGIFNWMLEGLKRLKNNNFLFSNTHSITEKARIYALTSDPLKVFCDDLIVPGDDEFEPKNLYSIFLKFCSYNNVDPSMNVKSLLSFQRQLSNILKARDDLNFLSKPAGHKNQVHYFGFSIKDPKNINNDSNPENPDSSKETSSIGKTGGEKKENKNENPPKDPPDNDDRNPENSVQSNDNKGHNNFDIDSLPDGPVKNSLREEQELKEFEKHQETKNDNKKDPENSEDSPKETSSNDKNNSEKSNDELSNSKILEIKNRILDVIKHGPPSNELSNINRLINLEYGLDSEAIANIIKSLISENSAALDSFKKHLITYTGGQEPETDEAPKKKEDEKHKPENPPKILKNFKTCYYKIMDHFDAYPDSYFDGSDIIRDSYRPIYQKNSSNISFILVEVEIPENLSKQPMNWFRFLSDSQVISSKQFEALSGGDAQ